MNVTCKSNAMKNSGWMPVACLWRHQITLRKCAAFYLFASYGKWIGYPSTNVWTIIYVRKMAYTRTHTRRAAVATDSKDAIIYSPPSHAHAYAHTAHTHTHRHMLVRTSHKHTARIPYSIWIEWALSTMASSACIYILYFIGEQHVYK